MTENRNPCAEIPLENSTPMTPWAQVDLMNMLRRQNGKRPFTADEIREIMSQLGSSEMEIDSYIFVARLLRRI